MTVKNRPITKSNAELLAELTLGLLVCDGRLLTLSPDAAQMAISRQIGIRTTPSGRSEPEPSGVESVTLQLTTSGKRLQRVLSEVAVDRLVRETR
jgi:hypothetical protein